MSQITLCDYEQEFCCPFKDAATVIQLLKMIPFCLVLVQACFILFEKTSFSEKGVNEPTKAL